VGPSAGWAYLYLGKQTTPAMSAGVAHHVWTVQEIAALLDQTARLIGMAQPPSRSRTTLLWAGYGLLAASILIALVAAAILIFR
jgi:hypothetical protein